MNQKSKFVNSERMDELKLYRWHITRKLINPSLEAETIEKVDVTVIPSKEKRKVRACLTAILKIVR